MKQFEISVPYDELFEENLFVLSDLLSIDIDVQFLNNEIYKSNESGGTYGKAFLFHKGNEDGPFVLIDCFMDEEASLDIISLVVRTNAITSESIQEILENWRMKSWFQYGTDFTEGLFDTINDENSVLHKIIELREIEKIQK